MSVPRFITRRKLLLSLVIAAALAFFIYVQKSSKTASSDSGVLAPLETKSSNGFKSSAIVKEQISCEQGFCSRDTGQRGNAKITTATDVKDSDESEMAVEQNNKGNAEEPTATQREDIWWKHNIIYQIYPRSFQDSDGDGNGDLNGITQRLDYFQYLGVRILYLNPFYTSPMVDQGYDISNYMDVNPLFGSLADFEELIKSAHERDLKIVIDFVPNHTSDEHPWFVESRSNKENEKRNWYVWKDPDEPGGGPPTNWVSVGGGVFGSMWTLDHRTGQYYLHQYSKAQPDLNLHHPDVRESLKEVLAFWMNKGVDGFRVDAVAKFFEDPHFRDEHKFPGHDPSKPLRNQIDHSRTTDMPETHDVLEEWREYVSRFPPPYRLLVGEVVLKDVDHVMSYYGEYKDEFDFPLNFALAKLKSNLNAAKVEKTIRKYIDAVPKGKWRNWFTGTHDTRRLGTRVGEKYIRAFMVLVLTLPGTPITYYGEEIGMTDAVIPEEAKVDSRTRDGARSPMQWSRDSNAGISTSTASTWLPLASNYRSINVQAQKETPTSTLQLYRKLASLRCNEIAFRGLGLDIIHSDDMGLAYTRSDPGSVSKFLVVLNLGKGIWTGAFSGSGTVVADSEFQEQGRKVDFIDLRLAVGQAMVIHVN